MNLAARTFRLFDGFRRALLGRSELEPSDAFFDIHDLRVLNPLLERHGVPPLVVDHWEAETGAPGAARFVLSLLAADDRLRRTFPTALTDGAGGAFLHWLREPGSAAYGLTDEAVALIAAAFESDPGQRARRVYDFRPDMRAVFPFGLTPQQRGDYLAWLLAHGRAEMGVEPEQALWYLFQLDETPDRGLVPTYLLRPDWQERVPHGLTVFGWRELLAYLRAEHGLRGRWAERLPPPRLYSPWDELTLLRRARPESDATFPHREVKSGNTPAVLAWLDAQVGLMKPDKGWRAELTRDLSGGLPARRGVNLFGHFRFPCGLQQAAFAVGRSLHQVGVRTVARDMLPEFPGDLTDHVGYDGIELFDVTVACTGLATPPARYLERTGVYLRPGVYRIAVLYWESEEPPADLPERVRMFDEIWAPTRFLADAFRKRLTIPVVPMLPGLTLPAVERRPKSAFGLRDDRFLFLFTFDMASLMARKNPLALVEAFRRAFRPDEPIELAIKVTRGADFPADFAALSTACERAGVTLIDRLMPRGEVLGLLAACDCYVSLHRSEGLGLGMAEAMLLGKPVVATGYSGNVDFMTRDTAFLVDYERVPLPPDVTAYPAGSHWAEPSVSHAAEQMRRVFDHPAEAAATGARARAALEELMSMEAVGMRMTNRLAEIAYRQENR